MGPRWDADGSWFEDLRGLPTEEVEAWLCAYVDDIDALHVDGLTWLHRAVIERDVTVVEVVSRWVLDVDQRDRWGLTPLARAMSSFPWSSAVVELLVARGADPIAGTHEQRDATTTRSTTRNNHDQK